jgi:hypothetical protein
MRPNTALQSMCSGWPILALGSSILAIPVYHVTTILSHAADG